MANRADVRVRSEASPNRIRFTDTHGTYWRVVADLLSLGEHGTALPIGSDRACYRMFRSRRTETTSATTRLYAFRPSDSSRDLSVETLRAQLALSWIPDERTIARRAEAIQSLYDGRRGMGQR